MKTSQLPTPSPLAKSWSPKRKPSLRDDLLALDKHVTQDHSTPSSILLQSGTSLLHFLFSPAELTFCNDFQSKVCTVYLKHVLWNLLLYGCQCMIRYSGKLLKTGTTNHNGDEDVLENTLQKTVKRGLEPWSRHSQVVKKVNLRAQQANTDSITGL